MPFDDASARPEIKTNEAEIAIIDGMIELLSDPERWTQGHFHDVKLLKVPTWFWLPARFRTVERFCLLGALDRVSGEDTEAVIPERRSYKPGRRVHRRLDELSGARKGCWDFNDRSTHTKVLNLLHRVRASFE